MSDDATKHGDSTASPPPARQLGLQMTIALNVGNMIGAGIFLLPAQLAPYGSNAIYGWVLTIVGVLCLAAVLMIVSARISGGPLAYIEQTLGSACGFLIMWVYLVGVWTGLPAIAIAGVSYLSREVPALGRPGVAPLVTLAAIWATVAVNARGARSGGAVQLITSVLKVMPLIAVAIVAAVSFGSGTDSAGQIDQPISGGSTAAAATLALFSMLGFECATMPADKIRNPKWTVPVATITAPLIAGFIYVLAYGSVLFLLSGTRTASSPAPFADAIAPLLGSAAGAVVALFAAVSALGCVNGWVLVSGEIPLSLARDGVFPAWFGKTNGIGTPVRAQLVSGFVATLLVLANDSKSMSSLFAFFALVTTVTNLFLYAAVSAAALVLVGTGRIRSALLPVVAVPALAFSLWAFWGAGKEPSLWGVALLATGLPIYWLMRRGARPIQPLEANSVAPPV